jgi:hypothetical protein
VSVSGAGTGKDKKIATRRDETADENRSPSVFDEGFPEPLFSDLAVPDGFVMAFLRVVFALVSSSDILLLWPSETKSNQISLSYKI